MNSTAPTNSSSSTETFLPQTAVNFGFVIIIPGVMGNLLAIIFFGKAVKNGGYVVHCLLLALAVTDLLGCFLACYTAATAYTGDITNEALCNTLSFVTSLCPMSTAVVTCILAVERYLALCHPFKYSSVVTRKRACVSLGVSLACTALISLFPIIELGNYYMISRSNDGQVEIVCSSLRFQEEVHERIYGVLYGTVGLGIIAIVITSNVLVIKTSLSMRRNTVSPNELNLTSSETNRSGVNTEIKFAKMVGGVSLVLLCCWSPFMVMMVLIHVGLPFPVGQIRIVMILASLNFVIDPFVHIFLRKSFRQAIWRSVFCCGCGKSGSVMATTSVVQWTPNNRHSSGGTD